MALSDDLSKLTARAKEAEEHGAAAQGKAKADLEADRDNARAVGEQQAQALRETAEERKGKISDGWNDVQRSWNERITSIREDMERRKAEHDVHHAQKKAERAEGDAEYAIDFAYSAIVEAEYAVLDAVLARVEADELSAQPSEQAGAAS
jgi:hypothetical protein